MKNLVALAVLVICVASCYGIQWKDCGSQLSSVNYTMVTGCESTPVCDLPRGKHFTFTVRFVTNDVADNAASVIRITIDDKPVGKPTIIDECMDKHVGFTCPLDAERYYSFHKELFVEEADPEVEIGVQWVLEDDMQQAIFCVEFKAKITGSKNTKDQNQAKPYVLNQMPKPYRLFGKTAE